MFFRTYDSFLTFYFGNEYLIQLFLSGLFVLPWRRARSFFPLRLLAFAAVYFGIGVFFPIPLPWYYLVMFCIFTGGAALCLRLNFSECVFFGCNSYCIQFIASNLSYAAFMPVGVEAGVIWYFVFAALIFSTAYLAAYLLYFRRLGEDTVEINSILVLGTVVFFLIVSVFMSYYIALEFESNLTGTVWLKLFSALFGGVILMVNIMNNRNTELNKDKQILQLLLQKDKEEYERARHNEEVLNIRYHDLKKAQRLGIVSEEEEKLIHCYFTGNKALDIVLGAEARVCADKGIRFICTADGELLNRIGMRAYHVYSLMSNLIDNAVENLVKVSDESKREIRLSVQRRGGVALINISNYTEDSPAFKDNLPQTTKKNKQNHGFGTKSIKHVAEMYGGTARFSLDGQIFTVVVMIPLPETEEADRESV